MGRTFPAGDDQYLHPIVSALMFIACMASVFSIISFFCLSRKKSNTQKKTKENDAEAVNSLPPVEAEAVKTDAKPETTAAGTPAAEAAEVADEERQQPLPPPPGKGHLRASASYHHRSTSSSASSRGHKSLVSSMSVRVKQQYSKMEETTLDKFEKLKREKKLKHEDSIWKKTIILGEKCRVPDEEDDDTIICDDKGNRISAYHPKTPNSLPVSRQTSAIDQDALPSPPGRISIGEKIGK